MLIVDASGETEAVQLFSCGVPTFQVRSVSGDFFVDAFNMEAVKFTGGSGGDSLTATRGTTRSAAAAATTP